MKKKLAISIMMGLVIALSSGCAADSSSMTENEITDASLEETTTEEMASEETTTEITTEETTTEITTEATTEAESINSCPIMDEIKNAQPFEYSISVVQIADMLFFRSMTFDDVMQTLRNSKFDWGYDDNADEIIAEYTVVENTVTLDGQEMFKIAYMYDGEETARLGDCYVYSVSMVEDSPCSYYVPYIPGGVGKYGENVPDYFDFVDLLNANGITKEKQGKCAFTDSYYSYDMWYDEKSVDSGTVAIDVCYQIHKSGGYSDGLYHNSFMFDSSTGTCVKTSWDEGSKLIMGVAP